MHAERERLRVFISKSAPASVVFEVRRMGRDWFTVDPVASPNAVTPEMFALLRYTGDDRTAVWRNSAIDTATPLLDVVCSRSSPLEMTHCRRVARFNVADPLQRLALLARLATLRSEQRTANSEQRTANSEQRTLNIAECIREVQTEFDLHISVGDFASRLGVEPSTLGRWCRREGAGSTEYLLRWGKLRAVIAHIGNTGDTLAETSRRLGFSAPSNLSKTVRLATGRSLRELLKAIREWKE